MIFFFFKTGTCISCPTGYAFNPTDGSCPDLCSSTTYSVSWQGGKCVCGNWAGNQGDFDFVTGKCTCSKNNDNYCQCDTKGGHKLEWGCIGDCDSSCSPSGGKTCGDKGGC